MKYTVHVDDNFHYMDERERALDSEWDDPEAAEQRCRGIVDAYLASAYRPGMQWDELFASYTTFGEDPWILAPAGEKHPVSAWDYARGRCQALCRGE
jgi:hypothetical protein